MGISGTSNIRPQPNDNPDNATSWLAVESICDPPFDIYFIPEGYTCPPPKWSNYREIVNVARV